MGCGFRLCLKNIWSTIGMVMQRIIYGWHGGCVKCQMGLYKKMKIHAQLTCMSSTTPDMLCNNIKYIMGDTKTL